MAGGKCDISAPILLHPYLAKANLAESLLVPCWRLATLVCVIASLNAAFTQDVTVILRNSFLPAK